MDPVSVAAGVIGVLAPALQGIRLLSDDIERIRDVPDVVKSIKSDLHATDTALESLRDISEPDWQSLGETVASQATSSIQLSKESCDKFKAALDRWTRHSSDGHLSWQDRTKIGLFKQGQIKSFSQQLQKCKATLSFVVQVASVHGTLRQEKLTKEAMDKATEEKTEIGDSIESMNKEISLVNSSLNALIIGDEDPTDTQDDWNGAIRQTAVEQRSLGEFRKLLEELRASTDKAIKNASRSGGTTIQFAGNNSGIQMGINHGIINHTGTNSGRIINNFK